MEKPFAYGSYVFGDNFTDRVKETKRISANFNAGINTILIAPRRQGKTSLVNHVIEGMDNPSIKIITMDIYDCRSEYEFYERFTSEIVKSTAGKMENISKTVGDFLGRITPKISLSPDAVNDFSLSLGISPKTVSPKEALDLPERIATKKNVHIIICIDEFQQIGLFPNSLEVQKRIRGIWQLQKNVSYCLYGSKKHSMEKLFQSRKMPFYQFGDMIFMERIPTEDWVKYICSRFGRFGKTISEQQARDICEKVENHSSYVQQYAWNVMVEAGDAVTDEDIKNGYQSLMNQVSVLFVEQAAGLTSFQMNFLRAISDGVHSGFGSAEVLAEYGLGSKSNVTRLQKSLIEKELIEKIGKEYHFIDPVFKVWIRTVAPR